MTDYQQTLFGESKPKQYSHRKWAKLVKDRDGWHCANEVMLPNLDHTLYEMNAHHISPKKFGGENILSNGITYCRACHLAQHPEYQQKFIGVIKRHVIRIGDFLRSFIGMPPENFYYSLLEFLTDHTAFRPLQKSIIKTIVEKKKHVFVVMPTGFGKSLLYQIPGIISKKPSLIISPLKALQFDQVKQSLERWIPATYINSSLNKSELDERLVQIKEGNIPFVFAHPKQLLDFSAHDQSVRVKFHKPLTGIPFRNLVIDEVHVIKSQGLSFVKEYLYINRLIEIYNNPQLILLTATASEKSRQFISERLCLQQGDVIEFIGNFIRPEISLEVHRVNTYDQVQKKFVDKDQKLTELLKNKPTGKTIIFSTTTKEVDDIHKRLVEAGIVACKYHSKLSENDKEKYFKIFTDQGTESADIMVATSAFGMGINIPNIHQVIHYSLPFGIVDYYQQIGRAGRDGGSSVAQLLVDEHNLTGTIDFINLKSLEAEKDLEMRELLKKSQNEEKQALLDYIAEEGDRWEFIQRHFGEPTMQSASVWPLLILILIAVAFLIFIR